MAFALAGAGFSFSAIGSADQTSSSEKASQAAALDGLLSVLLSAGYFRVRSPKLTPFDKVVGGLCWAITGSGVAVNVDVLYDEDLPLGQKIAVGENIVKALRTMGCPAPLQSHQLQGGDYVGIFPAVQFLVKKVLEYRKVTGNQVRAASEAYFRNSHAMAAPPSPATGPAGSGAAFLESINARFKPARKYRPTAALWESASAAPEARVHSCLLEFGERTVAAASVTAPEGGDDAARGSTAAAAADLERKFAALQRSARAEEESARQAALRREGIMLGQMTDARSGAVSGSSVGAILGLQSEELRRAAAEYQAQADDLRALAEGGELMANTKLGRAAAHARRIAALTQKAAAAELARDEQARLVEAATAASAAVASQLSKVDKQQARASEAIATQDARIAALGPEETAQLERLFESYTRSEMLVQQVEEFRAGCAEQLAELQARLAALEAADARDRWADRAAEVTAAEAEMRGRYTDARRQLGGLTREVQRLARLLDEVPSQSELLQYERRFAELGEQVSEKLDETRKYFTLYNMLDRKRQYLSKQDSLLGSMEAIFADAMKTKAGKAALVEKCAGIVASVEDGLQRQVTASDAKKAVRAAKAAELQRLVDGQREYFRAVKSMQALAERNELLGQLLAVHAPAAPSE